MQLPMFVGGDPNDDNEDEVGFETGADEVLGGKRHDGYGEVCRPIATPMLHALPVGCAASLVLTIALDSMTSIFVEGSDTLFILNFEGRDALHFQRHNYSQRDKHSNIDKQIAIPRCRFAPNSWRGCYIKSSKKEVTNPPEMTSNVEIPNTCWVYTKRLFLGDVKSAADCTSDTGTYDAAIHISSIIYFLPLMLLTLCRLSLPSTILILTTSWTPRTTILVLYLGVSSVSAHPIRQLHPVTLTDRQTNTVWTVPLKGWPNTGYCAMLQFGINKPQKFCMIVDTGSSNTAVAATPDKALGGSEFFNVNSTGQDFVVMGRSVSVTYSSGDWSGYLVKDKLGFEDFSMVYGVFALITSSNEFFIERADWAGILGLAYRSLAKPNSDVGTIWDSVRGANSLRDIFSMQLCPPRESGLFPGTFLKQGGYMTLGGINTTHHQPDKQIHYTKIVKERFFNILLTDISVGDRRLNISCKEFNTDKTIVDSGTTDIYFPEKVFEAVKNCFTDYFKDGLPMMVPEEFWIGERKLLWQAAHIEEIYECFPTIHLSMADHQNSSQQFTLAIVPQLYLRQIDVQAGEADPAMCPPTSPCDAFTFGVKPRAQGTVIGANAMLGYYTVFDREEKRVGFVESTCEYRNSKAAPHISGPHPRAPEDCAMPDASTPWATITYCCGAITMTLATTMTVIVVTVQLRRCLRKKRTSRTGTLPKRTINKLKTAHHLATQSLSKICCSKVEAPTEESYHTTETTPPSPLGNIQSVVLNSPPDSDDNDEIIVASPQPIPELNGTEMVVMQPAIQETSKKAKVSGASNQPRRKQGSKRWKRRHQPVMESETDGGASTLEVGHISRPTPATTRSCDRHAFVYDRQLYPFSGNTVDSFV